MATELAAGNNDTLFDHSVDDRPTPVSPAEAARLVLACQGYSMGGRITFEQKQDGSADACPLVKGAVAIVRGANLFQTLMLNMCCYSDQGEPFHFDLERDLPAWDRSDPAHPRDRNPDGYLDLLTWQSRRIRLVPERDDRGAVAVRTVVMMKGEQFCDGFHRHGSETMVAFTRNPTATEKQDPWPAVGFNEDRALWRDSSVLFESIADVQTRPKTLTWLNYLADEGYLDRSSTYRLDLCGLSSDQAKVLLWRHERLPLPLVMLDNRQLLYALRQAILDCEEAGKALRQGVWWFAKLLLLRDESKQPGTEQLKDIRNYIDFLGADRRFWSSLEVSFHQLLAKLAGGTHADAAQTETACSDALRNWHRELNWVARTVFHEVVGCEDDSARSLKAGVVAERIFNGALQKAVSA